MNHGLEPRTSRAPPELSVSILDRLVIERILTRLGQAPQPARRGRARKAVRRQPLSTLLGAWPATRLVFGPRAAESAPFGDTLVKSEHLKPSLTCRGSTLTSFEPPMCFSSARAGT